MVKREQSAVTPSAAEDATDAEVTTHAAAETPTAEAAAAIQSGILTPSDGLAERPLRVIHVIGGGEFGGAEQHILDLLTVMPTFGVQGKVICFYEASFSQALRERGIEVEVLDYGRFDVRLTSGLRRIFRSEKPDLIHTHGVKANFFARAAARDLEDVPLVTTIHSLLQYDYENRMSYSFASLMERVSRRWNDHFIAVSHAIRDSLLAEQIPPEQITVVHHGIDTDKFRPAQQGAASDAAAARSRALREEWGVPDDAYVIGSVGRLVRIKGIAYAIKALPRVLKSNPQAHLVIVGSGPDEATLRSLTAQLGLGGHVTFAGFRQDVPDCLRAFDCFISPSLSEGLGLNILEAMATQLPVAVTGVGGIRDFTEHGVNGYMIETRSSEDLADKLIAIMDDPERAAQMAEAARQRVERRFSQMSMGEGTVRVYRRLLAIRQTISLAQTPAARRVVISGYYGYGNSGDEAVLHAILQALRKESARAGIMIAPIVLSINPHATTQMHGVQAVHRFNLRQILRHVRRSDGLISGGGSLLQDMTGRMTIPYYLGIIKLAQWLGKPTFIYSHGVGPIESKSFYPFIRHAYRSSQYVSVRDRESGDLLQEIGIDSRQVDVVSDPVIGLALQPQPRLAPEDDAERLLIVGVSVRFWRPNREELAELAEALSVLLDKEPRVTLRFLPFHMPNDIEASQYVMERMNPIYKRRIEIVTDAIYPLDMLREVSACDLIIGMRLHSLIYAAAYRIPLLGISYDPKIDQFLARLEMTAASSTEDMVPQTIVSGALQLLHDGDAWRRAKSPLIDQLEQEAQKPAQQICQYLRK